MRPCAAEFTASRQPTADLLPEFAHKWPLTAGVGLLAAAAGTTALPRASHSTLKQQIRHIQQPAPCTAHGQPTGQHTCTCIEATAVSECGLHRSDRCHMLVYGDSGLTVTSSASAIPSHSLGQARHSPSGDKTPDYTNAPPNARHQPLQAVHMIQPLRC